MSKNKDLQTAPNLRFKGFTDDWEQRKLGDIVNISSGWAPSNFKEYNSEGNLFIKVDDLNYSNRIQNDSKMKVAENLKYKKMAKGSTIFPKRGAAIMTNKVRILGEDSYMDTNMMALEAVEIDSNFLYTFINRTGLFKIADTSTIPQINNKHIEPYQVKLPRSEEQLKIGLLFKRLDNTITLHQRKLDQLNQLKEALLQQMFPGKGEKVPKLRFAGFEEDWEERKLGKIIKTHSIKPYIVEPTDKGNYPIIQQGDNSIYGYADGEPFYSYQGVTLFGDHTVSIYKPSEPFFIATDALKILSADDIDGYFLYVLLMKYKPQSQGYKRHFTILKQENVWITENRDEQQKIGKLFKNLESNISFYQQKLKQLQNMKQVLLQNMFI